MGSDGSRKTGFAVLKKSGEGGVTDVVCLVGFVIGFMEVV